MNYGFLSFPNRLYAITDRHLARLPHDEIVAQLLVGGARTIQIREKELSPRELLEVARACLKLTRAVGARLIINDFVEVALAADADGVHLGQEDRDVDEARSILGPDRIIGLSTHSESQFRHGLTTSADYLAVGPIYDTSTKENASDVVGLGLLREIQALKDRPVVAIGGIDLHRAPRVVAAGADLVAVISALYPVPDFQSLTETSEIAERTQVLIKALAD